MKFNLGSPYVKSGKITNLEDGYVFWDMQGGLPACYKKIALTFKKRYREEGVEELVPVSMLVRPFCRRLRPFRRWVSTEPLYMVEVREGEYDHGIRVGSKETPPDERALKMQKILDDALTYSPHQKLEFLKHVGDLTGVELSKDLKHFFNGCPKEK